MDFGKDIDIGETRYQYLVLVNSTAIPAGVRVWCDTYQAPEQSSVTPASSLCLESRRSMGKVLKGRREIRLSDEHEVLRPFYSEEGRVESGGWCVLMRGYLGGFNV